VETGQPKKFGTVFFKDLLRPPDYLDHFVGLVGFETSKLHDRHGYLHRDVNYREACIERRWGGEPHRNLDRCLSSSI
jgi:hypothetical protein